MSVLFCDLSLGLCYMDLTAAVYYSANFCNIKSVAMENKQLSCSLVGIALLEFLALYTRSFQFDLLARYRIC